MRRLTIAYLILTAWLFGWLISTFGLGLGLIGTALFASPLYFAWRISNNSRPAKQREYGYLAVFATLAIVGTVFLVNEWYSSGMDSVAIFNRECRELRNYITRNPGYRDIKIDWGSQKENYVTLSGSVHSIRLYDNLITTVEQTIRYGRFYDGVDYPGKTSSDELSVSE